MKIDNLNGEWIETETASDEALEEARDSIDQYYPEGRPCSEGQGYYDRMREAVLEIDEELTWRRRQMP